MKTEFIALGSALFLAFVGYFVSRALSVREKKREMIVNYLIDAYEFIGKPFEGSKEYTQAFCNAIFTIQLFGTEKQIELAIEYAKMAFALAEFKRMTAPDPASVQRTIDSVQQLNRELLLNLRNHLRKELSLKECKQEMFYIG